MSLVIVDVCLSDFFQGTTLPCLAVPVQQNTTAEQFMSDVANAYQHQMDFPEIDIDKEVQLMGECLHELPFSNLDPSTNEGEGESVYAYVIWAPI